MKLLSMFVSALPAGTLPVREREFVDEGDAALKRKTGVRALSMVTAIVLALSPAAAGESQNQTLKEQYPIAEFNGITTDNSIKTYDEYLDGNRSYSDTSGLAVEVDLSASPLLREEDGVQFLEWGEETQELTFSFTVPQTGFYNLAITYMTPESSFFSPKRHFKVDGEYPYQEAMNIEFRRQWADDGRPFKNPIGEDVRPGMIELYQWQEYRVEDTDGLYGAPLKILLTQGEHTLTLENVYEPLRIREIQWVSPESLVSYAQLKKTYAGLPDATQEIKIDAEYASVKSDGSLQMQYSSDPRCDPAPKGQRIVNTIGGTSWGKPNQAITYTFQVEQAGLYKINWRMRQKDASGLPVYRQILIDGKVPFEEFESLQVDESDWTYRTLANEEGEPYLVYLTQGEHDITFVSKATGYEDILQRLDKILNSLSYIVRKIVLVTSLTPDPLFDYQLEKKIPDLLDTLKLISETIDEQVTALRAMTDSKNKGAVGTLLKTQLDIDEMIEDPSVIAAKLSNLTNAQTSVSSWLTSTNFYSMELDYITLTPPDQEIEDYNTISIEQIARVCTLSVSRLKTKFCTQVGMAPMQYYNYQRLHEAKKLLANGEGITQIAYKLQFSSSSHFSHFFKKYTHMTPRQYQKACRNKDVTEPPETL